MKQRQSCKSVLTVTTCMRTGCNLILPARSERLIAWNLFLMACASVFPEDMKNRRVPSKPSSRAARIPFTTSSANAMSMFAYSHLWSVACSAKETIRTHLDLGNKRGSTLRATGTYLHHHVSHGLQCSVSLQRLRLEEAVDVKPNAWCIQADVLEELLHLAKAVLRAKPFAQWRDAARWTTQPIIPPATSASS